MARYRLLAQLPKDGVGAEIGSWRGDFSAVILRRARPARLFLVDPWRHSEDEVHEGAMYGGAGTSQADMDGVYQAVLDRFKQEIGSGRMVVLREPSVQAAKRWSDEQLDWVYLDGDHTYEGVRADLEAYWRLVKRGGFLGGDDYEFPGWWDDGVTRAVDEFVRDEQLDLTVMGSQFLIRKPGGPTETARLAGQ